MPMTFGRAREVLAQYAGKGGLCASEPKVALFVHEVLQYLLYNQAFGNQRKFCFVAEKGCIVIPYELEVPMKVRVDGAAGTVWNRWYEFYHDNDLADCILAARALIEEPNTVPTVYDVPLGAWRIGVIGTCKEAETAQIIIKGLDLTGKPVYAGHRGETTSGELLSIKNNELTYSVISFSQVTEVVKTITRGYVKLYAVNPQTKEKVFLSEYAPSEETPQYRKFKIVSPCEHRYAKVSILGRIRLKENYADSDLIPFDNIHALTLAAQKVNAEATGDVQIAQYKGQAVADMVNKEQDFKKTTTGQPIEISGPTVGGSIANIYGSFGRAGGWGFGRGR
jgi:hypothetical protein